MTPYGFDNLKYLSIYIDEPQPEEKEKSIFNKDFLNSIKEKLKVSNPICKD